MTSVNFKPHSLFFSAFLLIFALSGCSTTPPTTPSETPPTQEDVPSQAGVETSEEITSASYQAGVLQPFDQAQFERAQKEGKTVFLDFYASWCPTCRANAPLIEAGLKGSSVVGFRVDYDTAVELKKQFKVTTQSTYILLEDGNEKRKVGMLTEEDMRSFIPSLLPNSIVF